MQDLNWKTWGLVFLVAIGAAFEGLKRLPNSGIRWDFENIKLSAANTTPYQVKYQRQVRAPQIKPLRPNTASMVGGASVSREALEKFIAANATHKGEFAHKEKGGEGMPVAADAKAKKKKKKLKDDEEWEIVVDPATGKRYRRKVKKVAKVEDVQPEMYKEEPKKESSSDSDEDIDGLLSKAISTGTLPPTEDKADSPYADLEEWKRRLLNSPDAAETRRFIEHYKNNLVTADIFYKIVNMMVEDSRPQMQELGVLCAGLTPSVASFQVLIEVIKAERSGSSVRTYSESFMTRYSDLNNLHVLERILTAPTSSFAGVKAAERLDASAAIYLSPSKNKPSRTSASTAQAGHSNSGYYRRFVAILEALTRNPDTELKDKAAATLANLKSLMMTPGSQPLPAVDPNNPSNVMPSTAASN